MAHTRRCRGCGGTDTVVRRDTYREALRSQFTMSRKLRTDAGRVLGVLLFPPVRALKGLRVVCRACGWETQVWR
ncbi:hypothetical protein [Streptomyces ficellus]|uniref:Uncharacterized protein n=1 Tax=Streptomyces ficellus TaxID=1977088 RepID=A0A6I6FKM1_9ACTN|nr:hypothetical protein [Streptomyces ficellus]QGV81977.1 hypothetical protein EIZ62_29755 [Streptomyces ficellus]